MVTVRAFSAELKLGGLITSKQHFEIYEVTQNAPLLAVGMNESESENKFKLRR